MVLEKAIACCQLPDITVVTCVIYYKIIEKKICCAIATRSAYPEYFNIETFKIIFLPFPLLKIPFPIRGNSYNKNDE